MLKCESTLIRIGIDSSSSFIQQQETEDRADRPARNPTLRNRIDEAHGANKEKGLCFGNEYSKRGTNAFGESSVQGIFSLRRIRIKTPSW